MIEVKIPYFTYNNEVILQNINLQFQKGLTHGIIGLNGAGKTTFFNLLAGIVRAEGCIFNYNTIKLTRKEIAFLDTDLYFYPKLTAKEFLSVFKKGNSRYNEYKLAELFRVC
jgi:ABC-2 type transport system ATP-binding protein